MSASFELISSYEPSGDQPQAIAQLVQGIEQKKRYQTLLGVTGSGKTFTMAQLIVKTGRPTLIMAPNKTLAAQLYSEMREFFPNNAVEYFVSYYDYYQPEAYVPSKDLFIEKDAAINEQVEQMRLSATKALMERDDVIIVATVSAIYGLGDPAAYMNMLLPLKVGEHIGRQQLISRLIQLQYQRNDLERQRGTFSVRGDIIDIFPAEGEDELIRVTLFDAEIERIQLLDPLTLTVQRALVRRTIYPKNHYVTPKEQVDRAIETISLELEQRLKELREQELLLEAQRLEQRTYHDIEFLREIGHCPGIENYSRHLTQLESGKPPPTLLSYLPENHLIIFDESHVMLPQLHAMFHGDRRRKENLVRYGFRLPSCLDNRPWRFEEVEAFLHSAIFVSATPGPWEMEQSENIVEQIVRPTGLLDPIVDVRPVAEQVSDIHQEILSARAKNHRVMITTLTKKMSEDLAAYLSDLGVRAQYLHSDLDTIERVELIEALRKGEIEVLIGINLLREGLDVPEVALIAIFDADKEGFLRSRRSLIQTIGRAARHHEGRAVLYADRITDAMREALDETQRRRHRQEAYNQEHGKVPQPIRKALVPILDGLVSGKKAKKAQKATPETMAIATAPISSQILSDPKKLAQEIASLEQKMRQSAADLKFDEAGAYRDRRQLLVEALKAL